IQQQFLNYGLLPGWHNDYQQKYPVFQDSIETAVLNINNTALKRDTDFIVSSNSRTNISFETGEVVFVGYGQSDSLRNDYININAKGKVVLIFPTRTNIRSKGKRIRSFPPDLYTLQQAAQKNGAVAMLIADRNFPRSPSPSKGYMYVNESNDTVPDAYIISDSVANAILGTGRLNIRKKLKAGNAISASIPVNIKMELKKNHGVFITSNVIGMIEGTDKKEEAIIITAHYDHLGMKDSTIYFGADDDGSGTVTVLELARVFSQAAADGARPRRNIIFMTVSGEEEGLWGSSFYSEHPAFPLDKTSIDLNIDMIGRVEDGRKSDDTLNYIYVVGDHKISSELRNISESVNDSTAQLKLDYKFNAPDDAQRIYYRSDHYNFARHGVPIIFYFSGLHKDYHRPTDTPDKINYDLLQKRARLIFHTAWEVANRDAMVVRDLPL
ncbi:MAG: M28 family peptidase, partial [Flavitalea sp.]